MKGKGLMIGAALAMTSGSSEAVADAPDLGWLAGHWCSEEDGRRIDEVWLPSAGGAMHGLSRTVSGGKVESFEFMHVAHEGGKTTFQAQPQGAPPTAFVLAESSALQASFTNPAHDFPNRIEYRRDGDRLHATISGPGREGPMEIPFDYRRCD